jgi:hypothetical protein
MFTKTPSELKMRKDTRTLVLQQIPGQKTLSSTGLADPRLFTGENKLLAIRDMQTSLWGFKYLMGGLPEPLKQQFTSFHKLYAHGRDYFKKRGIEIVEVLD